MNLIEENLELCTLPEGKSEKLYTDDNLAGFGIRVRRDAKGRAHRKWFFQYRAKADGSQHRVNLGNVDRPAAVPADKARQQRRQFRSGCKSATIRRKNGRPQKAIASGSLATRR